MAVKYKKLAVLACLRRQYKPLSLPEIREILGNSFSERSVRRWLAQLVEEGSVIKSGQKRGTRYLAIGTPEIKRVIKVAETTDIFSQKSREAIAYIKQPLFKRQPVSYNHTWFDSYYPNETHYISPALVKQFYQFGKRTENEKPAGTYAKHIYNRLLIDLSYNSSRLEGNTYSLLDTKRLVLEGASPEGKLDEEKIMILNHKEAIRYLVDNASKIKINDNEVRTLHFLLADGLIEAKYAGQVRDHGVRIGSSTYIPYENPVILEKQLKNICEKAALINEPYEQSLFLLIQISYLQAFIDVNKRTARLSANIPLIKNNLVPLSFNDIEKDDYVCAMLAIYELNDVNPIVDLYRYSYLRTCQLYDRSLEAMGFDEIRVRYRQQRRDLIRYIIVNQLTDKKMHEYIKEQVKKLIKIEDQVNFIEDVTEDLKQINPQRIAGLGISLEQLEAWQSLNKL